MMISFHFPPIAARAAVSGQSVIGFRRRVCGIVTLTCLLAGEAACGYDARYRARRAREDTDDDERQPLPDQPPIVQPDGSLAIGPRIRPASVHRSIGRDPSDAAI